MYSSCLARLAAACRPGPLVALVVLSASIASASPKADATLRAAAESAPSGATVSGSVVDPLGAAVAQAAVALVGDDGTAAETTSSNRGEFTFVNVPEGRYRIEVRAAGFENRTTGAMFVGAGSHAATEVGLQIGAVTQQVVVSATAGEVPQ